MSRKSSYILPLHRESTFNSDSQGSRVGLLHQGKSNGRWKNHLLAGLAEFVGTYMFLFFSFGGTQLANSSTDAVNVDNSVAPLPNTSVLLYIALSFGFSLMVNVWVFYRISGGLFNPSVCGPAFRFTEDHKLTVLLAGNARSVPGWRHTLDSGHHLLLCTDARRHGRGRCCVGHVSRFP